MPATLPIPQQVLSQPVSNYYQGKAIRQQLAMGEKELEQADDLFEMKKQAANVDSQNLALRTAEFQLKAGEYVREVGEAQAKDEAQQILALTDAAAKTDDPLKTMNETFPAFVASLPPGKTKDRLTEQGEDGYQAVEYEGMVSLARMIVNDKYESAESGDDLSEKEKEMQLYRLLGESPESAIDLAYDNLDVTSSADSRGNVTVTNKRTKDSYQISARSAEAAGLEIPDGDNELGEPSGEQPWDTPVGRVTISGNLSDTVIAKEQAAMLTADVSLMAALEVSNPDFEEGVGAASILQRGVNSVLQAVSFNALPRVFAEETASADQLRKFNQSVRASLTTSDKGAVWDLQMVEKLLPDPDNIFKDPEGEAIKFTQTVQAVSQKRENNVAALNGRKPKQIERKKLGTENDPLIAVSMAEAEQMAADPKNEGSFVMVGGVIYPIESGE